MIRTRFGLRVEPAAVTINFPVLWANGICKRDENRPIASKYAVCFRILSDHCGLMDRETRFKVSNLKALLSKSVFSLFLIYHYFFFY